MHQLSGLDAVFLYLETAQMPMHVGALHLFELPAGTRGRWATALRKHVASRLPAAPVLRRRLWWMPLNLANPAWVDAVPDLRWHVVEHPLPKGAGLAELEAAVARLHPEPLDRDRPLWRMHVFDRLAPGPEGQRRVGLYTQLHHAAVDGQAAVALANVLLDLGPEPRAIDQRASRRDKTYQLGMAEMLRGALGGQAMKVAQIVRQLPSTVGTLKDAALLAASRSALLGGRSVGKAGAKGAVSNLTLAPRLPINTSVTERRTFAAVSLPLEVLRALGRARGATLNDMVLMLCSTALRRFYRQRRLLPRKSLIAAVPISLRAPGDTDADNQASLGLVSLGTHIADTEKRLAHVQAATATMKSAMGSVRSLLPTDYPSLGIPWLLEAATALYGKARIADRIPRVANLVISNVAGPPVPLYMAGARMLTNYPTSIVVHGLGLNVTVQSYAGSLDFGLMADGEAMPDVRDLAAALVVALDELRELSDPQAAAVDAEAPSSATGPAARTAGEVGQGAVDGAMRGVVSQVGSRATPTRRRGRQ